MFLRGRLKPISTLRAFLRTRPAGLKNLRQLSQSIRWGMSVFASCCGAEELGWKMHGLRIGILLTQAGNSNTNNGFGGLMHELLRGLA